MTEFTTGEKVTGKATVRSSKTTPLPLFTEGTAIDMMKNIGKHANLSPEDMKALKAKDDDGLAGIGTARTRGAIITGQEDRKLIQFRGKQRQIIPTEKGLAFYHIASKAVKPLASPEMTAKWEQQLLLVETGEMSLGDFTKEQERVMAILFKMIMSAEPALGASPGQQQAVDPLPGHGSQCPKCKADGAVLMTRVVSKDGPSKGKRFLSCSSYPACDYAAFEQTPIPPLEGHGKPCLKCGKPMVTKIINKEGPNKGKRFLACSGYPACTHAEFEQVPIKPLPGDGEACPKCGKPVSTRQVNKEGPNKGKRFLSCSDYPACGYAVFGDDFASSGKPKKR